MTNSPDTWFLHVFGSFYLASLTFGLVVALALRFRSSRWTSLNVNKVVVPSTKSEDSGKKTPKAEDPGRKGQKAA